MLENSSIPAPLPRIAAFEKLGLGLFVHWGLYSQRGCGEWTQSLHKIPSEEYQKLFHTFTAEDFDAEDLARTAKNAGMNYIVLTTRHHEGFSLYDTCGLNEFDAPHSPAKRDLVAEFVAACRKYDVIPFFYHTTLDWFWNGKTTWELTKEEFAEYIDYLCASVEILCRNYGKIGGLWFDGNWSRPDCDWQLDRFYGMIRSLQPDAIIVNNTGLSNLGEYGHHEIDSVTFENNSSKPLDRNGRSKYVAAEVCLTMNTHWGIGANDYKFKSPAEIIEMAAHSRGNGANFLLNIGPTAQGGIPDYERALLSILGKWARLYAEAVYGPKPDSSIKAHGRDMVLKEDNNYYYLAFDMLCTGDEHVTVNLAGMGSRVIDGISSKVKSCTWLDNGQQLPFVQDTDKRILAVRTNGFPYGTNTVVRVMKIVTE